MQVCRMPELSVKIRPDLELIALGGAKGDGVRTMDDRCSPLSLVTDKSGSVGRGGLALSVEHCVVCGDRASGRHYGAISCEGCKGFFKRSIRKQLGYTCRGSKDCEVTKHHRNRCQYCRLQKCLSMGMRSDSVQSERKPMGDRKGDSPTSLLSPASVFSADLSTLASVVTSLANMRGGMMPLGMGVVGNSMNSGPVGSVEPTSPSLSMSMSMSPSNLQVKIEEEDDSRGSREDQSGGESNSANPAAIEESASALHVAKENLITRAFEALAKSIHNGDGNNDSLRPKSAGDYDEDEEMMELDASLLSEAQVPFHLTTPSPMPVFLNAHYICESASRLLFLSVHWARSIPAFQILNPETQVALVRGSWCDLFVLGLAQCSHIMSLPAMLTSLLTQLQASLQSDSKLSTQRIRQVADHVIRLHEFVNHMANMQVDEHEYAYLKAVVLFSYDHVGLPQAKLVEKCQNKALQELQSYVSSTWPNEAEKRLPQLLLRLPSLRSLQPALLEDLFFAGLIGTVHIDSVIPYILRMEATEYNGVGSPSGESCSPLPQAPNSSSVLQQPRLSPAH